MNKIIKLLATELTCFIIIMAAVMLLMGKYEDALTFNFSEEQVKAFIGVLSSLYSAFLGFIVSTIAIMATVLEFKKFEPLHASGQTSRLIRSFMSLSWITLLCLLLNMSSLLVFPNSLKCLFFLNISALVLWMAIFVLCMSKFHVLLQHRYSLK